MNLVVVSGGTSDPSSTRLLADRIAARLRARAGERGEQVTASVVELRPLAADLASATVTGVAPPAVQAAIDRLADADALIVASPVYKAGISGLVKSFFDVVDQDVLIATPVVLAATAGTARHALVVDDQLRGLFAYLRALPVPTGVFAAGEDWGTRALTDRIDRAAVELLVLATSGVRDAIRSAGTRYNRVFGGAGGGSGDIDLDTDLMRLATGGREP